MKSQPAIFKSLLTAAIFLVGSDIVKAQTEKDSLSKQGLYKEIIQMDSILFTAFNKRDLVKFGSLFTSDLEFYHDKGGLTGYDHTVSFMKDVAKNENGLRRELAKASVEVYPIPGYGAMQIGEHSFCHLENGKQDCGTFKFVHIWQKKNGEWKISRVVSYDH
ncbi:MAG TPA: nuclear transport factor 2 family protein [Chitinophagaceae bacterium]